MRRLGTMSRVSQGMGLVRLAAGDPPPIGGAVVDETLAEVGTVVDVIGPVSAPYAVVSPATSVDPVELLDARVYLRDD